MSTPAQVGTEQMIFRKTHAHTGRSVAVSPSNSAMRHLAYGRIILSSPRHSESFSNGNRETGLICLSGEASVSVEGKETELGKHDAMYIPRESSIRVATKRAVYLAEFSSDVTKKYPQQVVRFAETAKDPGLNFTAGGP